MWTTMKSKNVLSTVLTLILILTTLSTVAITLELAASGGWQYGITRM